MKQSNVALSPLWLRGSLCLGRTLVPFYPFIDDSRIISQGNRLLEIVCELYVRRVKAKALRMLKVLRNQRDAAVGIVCVTVLTYV